MTQDAPNDNEILPASGEDQHHLGVHIFDLRFSSCRYIVRYNDENEALFCGEVVHRVSYCQTHYRACYTPTPKRG